jgi:hypothetical protein
MRKFISVIPLAFIFLWTDAYSENREVAFILKSRGIVSVNYTSENKNIQVSRGYIITSGAFLQTGIKGFALIKYINSHSLIIIKPLSKIQITGYKDNRKYVESIDVKYGEIIFDIVQPKKCLFDMHTPTAIIDANELKGFIIVNDRNGETALYNLSGKARISDNNYNSWKDVPSETSCFISKRGFVHVSKISPHTMPVLNKNHESSLELKKVDLLTHSLTIKSTPNGLISPSGTVMVKHGVPVDIEAISETDYTFTGWNVVDGNVAIRNSVSSKTQVSLMSNAIVQAEFDENPSILSIYRTDNGVVEPSGKIYAKQGVPTIVRIAPNAGYDFTGWKTRGDITIKEINPFKTAVTVNDRSGKVKPEFKRKQCTVSVFGSNNGIVTPQRILKKYYGDTIKISATPHNGYRFIQWEIVSGFIFIADIRNPNTVIICDSTDASLQAVFSDNAVEVSILKHNLATIQPSGNFYVIRNSLFSVLAEPREGFTLKRWEVERGKARVKGLHKAEIKCKTPFEILPIITSKEYILTLLGSKFGTVYPAKKIYVKHNNPFTVMAEPYQEKFFIRWKLIGGWADIQDPYNDTTTLTLTEGDAVIQAEFAETICSLSINSSKGGYTEPSGKIINYNHGEINIHAIPNPKAAFIGWEITDGKENITFSDTLTIAEQTVTSGKGDASINAVFSTETVEMNVSNNGLGSTKPDGMTHAVKNKWKRITAKPNEFMEFVKWTLISGNNAQIKDAFSAETEVNPGNNEIVIKALFQSTSSKYFNPDTSFISFKNDLQLRIDYDAQKGNISTENEISVKPGIPFRITAEPKTGFYLSEWIVIKGSVNFLSPKDIETIEFTIERSDAVISPIFREKPINILEIIFKDYENKQKTLTSKYW